MLCPLCPAAPCYHSKRQGCTWFSQFVFSFQFLSVFFSFNIWTMRTITLPGLKVEIFHQFSLSPFSSDVFTNHIDFPLFMSLSFLCWKALTLFENIHFRALLDEQSHRWILWNLDRIKNWGWHRVPCYTEIFIIRLVSNKYDELSFIQPAQTKYDKKTTSVRFLTHCKTLHHSHKALLEYKYSSSHFHVLI